MRSAPSGRLPNLHTLIILASSAVPRAQCAQQLERPRPSSDPRSARVKRTGRSPGDAVFAVEAFGVCPLAGEAVGKLGRDWWCQYCASRGLAEGPMLAVRQL